MTLDFVSEVDRRFFANNLLTNEDWEAGTDNYNDISDLLGMDVTINADNIADLPDELLSLDKVEGSCSPLNISADANVLPMDDISFDQDGDIKFDFSNFVDKKLEDYWKEQSDSSDSGIYFENGGVHIKQEPPSPGSSNCSDAGSDGFTSSSVSSPGSSALSFASVTTISEDIKPTIIINTAGAQLHPNSSVININSILNSKIKIQPKPAEGGTTPSQITVPPQVIHEAAVPNKRLVLTGEEFAKLTASGTLRFQPPGEVKERSPTPGHQTLLGPISSVPQGIVTGPVNTEGKAMKRQQRMIKNRESASLSRKRKKEYLNGLEGRLHNFNAENQKLKNENECLKRKLSILQMENEKLKKAFPMSSAKRTCLLAILIVFSFNIGSISNLLTGRAGSADSVIPNGNVHRGRQLMAVHDTEEMFKDSLDSSWSHPGDSVLRKLHQLSEELGWAQASGKMNQSEFEAMCPTFFNRTESMRLAEQLVGWMKQHEEEKKRSQEKRKRKKIRPMKMLKKALRGDYRAINNNEMRSQDKVYQVQVFEGSDPRNEFLNAIPRRNDTFYVLSFNTDYLLVPASAHNKTMRPRMSLVMPVMAPLNETMDLPPDNIGMMQIDCEVLGTRLIHVHKSAVPPPSQSWNSTHQGSERSWRDRT